MGTVRTAMGNGCGFLFYLEEVKDGVPCPGSLFFEQHWGFCCWGEDV